MQTLRFCVRFLALTANAFSWMQKRWSFRVSPPSGVVASSAQPASKRFSAHVSYVAQIRMLLWCRNAHHERHTNRND